MGIKFEVACDIKSFTSFKIGGVIGKVFYPSSLGEMEEILKKYPKIKVFGNLSNTLVSSFGVDEPIVITSGMKKVNIKGNKVIAECGVKGPMLAQQVAKENLSGMEFMIGFPGSVGGEVYMNASAQGQSIRDILTTAICYEPGKGLKKYSKEAMEFGYRTSKCQKDNLVVLQTEFELVNKSEKEIADLMKLNVIRRKASQPMLTLPNCGSIFKNAKCEFAGKLLESVGVKGLSVGGASVWEKHANFIVNANNATSLDVLELMYQMYSKVKERYDVDLEPEIRFLGGKNVRENELCQILYKQK